MYQPPLPPNAPRPFTQTNVNRPWYKKKRYQIGGGLLGLFLVLTMLVGIAVSSGDLSEPPEELAFKETDTSTTTEPEGSQTTPENTVASTEQPTETAVEDEPDQHSSESWETEILALAQSDLSKNEKFDQIEPLVKKYPLDNQTSVETAEYLRDEFVSGEYINTLIQDEEYALKNIYLSRALDLYIDDSLAHPLDRFAFDFYQNSKYIYRGVDAPDSEAVKANEDQMQASLTEMLLED